MTHTHLHGCNSSDRQRCPGEPRPPIYSPLPHATVSPPSPPPVFRDQKIRTALHSITTNPFFPGLIGGNGVRTVRVRTGLLRTVDGLKLVQIQQPRWLRCTVTVMIGRGGGGGGVAVVASRSCRDFFCTFVAILRLLDSTNPAHKR